MLSALIVDHQCGCHLLADDALAIGTADGITLETDERRGGQPISQVSISH